MEDCDLSSVFPVAKIKAQLLRDEGVGRLSGKAVRLIGACSAVFLRELAEASDGMEASQTEKANSRDTGTRHIKHDYESAERLERPAKRKAPDPSSITLEQLDTCVNTDRIRGFDFLVGTLENNLKRVPSYGATYRKRIRSLPVTKRGGGRESSKKGANGGDFSVEGMSSLHQGGSVAIGGKSEGKAFEESNLTHAIHMSLELSAASHSAKIGKIIEDDEDYG
jgi:hypothetical protein